MKTPDLPGSFIAAIAGNVVAVTVAFGAPLTGDQQKALLALAVTLGSVLVTAGAWLHGKRAENVDKLTAAKAAQPVPPAFTTGTSTSTTGGAIHGNVFTGSLEGAIPVRGLAKKPAAKKKAAPKKTP